MLYLFPFPVPWFLLRSCLFPVSLPMSSKSSVYIFIGPCLLVFSVLILWLLLPVFVLLSVLLMFGDIDISVICYRDIDFLAMTLISCSRRQLSCPLSVHFDICDYLDSDLCLFHNDFCLAPLNFFSTSLCNWVPSFTSPLPHVTVGLHITSIFKTRNGSILANGMQLFISFIFLFH